MTPETDRLYQHETAQRLLSHMLSKSLIFFYVLLAIVACAAGVAAIFVLNDCATVYGLSPEGRVWETYSFTCPNPAIEPLYDSRPKL